jgi:hypothetical protein
MPLLSAAVVAISAVLQVQSGGLAGRVVDTTSNAIPGATVKITGERYSASAVSDSTGRFRFAELANGTYTVTVSLAGFRTQTKVVRVASPTGPELLVTLSPGILVVVDPVVPKPADAYRMASAIAHVRIDRTAPDGPCGDAYVVTARHETSVLHVFRGRVPERLQLDQEAAGRCLDRGLWHEGFERPYRAGEEYVVFLAERPPRFVRLAGRSLAFRVRGEMVDLNGFAGVQGTVTLDEFAMLLEKLSGK